MTTTQNTTNIDQLVNELITTYNECLAEAERAENATYRFEWQLEARKAAIRIARRITEI